MRFPSVAFAALALAACGHQTNTTRELGQATIAPPEAWKGVGRIAVLPPDNWTHDIGLEYITWYRAVFNDSLRERGYRVTPVVEINRFMLKNRFNLTGEARAYAPADLCREFGSDAVMNWNITGDGPMIEMILTKADGTILWSSGEIALALQYNAHPNLSYAGEDHQFAVALYEVVLKMPMRP